MGRFNRKEEAGVEHVPTSSLEAVLPENPDPWYRTPHLLKLNTLMLVLIFSSSSAGYDGSLMNSLQTLSQWKTYFGNPSSAMLGLLNAIYSVGMILSLFPATWITDKYGRKKSMWCAFIVLFGGAAIQGASINLPMLVIGRLLLGVATCLLTQPAPILVSELAYPTHRGKVTSLYQTFYYVGAIVGAWTTYGTSRFENDWSWRIPSILQGAIPIIQFCLLHYVPESPRWLVANGKVDEAREILVRHHAGGDHESPLVAYEIMQIEESIRTENQIRVETSYLDLLRTAPNRRRTLIAVIVGFFAQWNGVTVVSYYLTLVLDTIGITRASDQTLINGILQVFNWIAAICGGAMMVDRLGRRTLFLISVAGMLASYIVWTALTSVFISTLNHQAGNAVVAFIFIYYFFYDIAWTPLLLAYPVEIFPYALRARGVAVTYASTSIGLITGQVLNPIAMSSLGWKYYIVFCCILAALFVTMWFLFPETKGRTLEEIAELFESRPLVPGAEDPEKAARPEMIEDTAQIKGSEV